VWWINSIGAKANEKEASQACTDPDYSPLFFRPWIFAFFFFV
jgi:hypothetical protein